MFQPKQGAALWGFIVLALVVSALAFFALQVIPARFRKPLIVAITFLGGLFYAVEFFWPVNAEGTNFLTPYLQPVSDVTNVVQAFALGLGLYTLVSVHGRNIVRQRSGWGFSLVLLAAIVLMAVPGLLRISHPNRYNMNLYRIFYNGGLSKLDAAMFSIIAFYIVSAAYRAFRIRSVEATILLTSAAVVMLGNVAIGQAITSGFANEGFTANFRFENLGNWLMTRVSSPALNAVDFGLGIGGLATSLRLWLSLERGSYFEKEL